MNRLEQRIHEQFHTRSNKRFEQIPIEYKPIIEKAMGVKLYDWQENWLFGDGSVHVTGGRRTGKTMTRIIFKVLVYKTLPLRHNRLFVDEEHGSNYDNWFKHEFMSIRQALSDAGLPVCEV